MQRPRLEQRPHQELKLELRQLLKLELQLRSPEFPEAKKGIAGLQLADDMLKDQGAIGILIGGLAYEIWKQTRTEKDLNSHKDVDVLVLSKDFKISKPFDGGIDWWMPHREFDGRMRSYGITFQDIWKNGSGARLRFVPRFFSHVSPGLYVLPPEKFVEMKRVEIESVAQVSVDDDTFTAFERIQEKHMGKQLMPAVRRLFGDKVLEHISFLAIPHE